MCAYSPVQNLSLAGDVAYCVFSLHQYEPRPGILLSSHASGDGAGGCEGGSGGEDGGDGGSPSHTSQVFLHFSFFASEYFLHFFSLQCLSVSTHGGGLLGGDGGGDGDGGGGEGDGGDGGGGEGGGGAG